MKSSTGGRETIQKTDRLIYLGHTIVITASSLIERAAKFFKFSKTIPGDCCNIHLNIESWHRILLYIMRSSFLSSKKDAPENGSCNWDQMMNEVHSLILVSKEETILIWLGQVICKSVSFITCWLLFWKQQGRRQVMQKIQKKDAMWPWHGSLT